MLVLLHRAVCLKIWHGQCLQIKFTDGSKSLVDGRPVGIMEGSNSFLKGVGWG